LLSQRIKGAESKSWCLGMLSECLVYSSMRLGVPFIAPKQLGAVESIPGRQILPSVAWRTGQSGAPPDTVRCTPDSPVPPSDRWLGHVSHADRATDCWLTGQSGAHRTVRCTPDSPVNYSRTPLITSREQQVRLSQPGAPDNVRCTTGHCLVHPDRADFG
jgi:hypothetical protein